jgi:hypothetical protein
VISAVRSLSATGRAGARAAVQEFQWHRLLGQTTRPTEVRGCDFPVAGRYLVTSEKGVFRATANRIEKLCDIPAFGIALAGDRIYLATWHRDASIVLEGAAAAVLQGGDPAWRELYRVRAANDAGRIHQIGALGDVLWLCNTALNTYTKIDRRTGAWLANVGPFKCAFGHPILVDHNHVNSVFAQPGYLLFSAFKINRQSAFGVIGDGRLRLHAYRNMGAHDCILAGDDFLFSDSYRFWDGGSGGLVVRNDAPIDRAYFDANAAYFVRGIAGQVGEMVVGNSHVGAREERMNGEGALLLLNDDRVVRRTAMPCAQVYDILREDGTHFDRAPAARSFAEAAAALERAFGPPVAEFPLTDTLSGEYQMKFNGNDFGRIEEYL